MDVSKRYFAFFVTLALAAAAVPVAFTLHAVGGAGNWHGVLPKGTTDSTYYYARIHEVLDGHPLIGNPYVFEYRDALPPAQFVPDVLAALPAFVLPFDLAMAFNVFVWALAFLALGFWLLRVVGVGRAWAALWVVVAYACAYSFMLRPVVMQVVYPALFLFLLALALFLQAQTRRRMLFLAAATAATYYAYTFLLYVVVLTLAVLFVRYLAARRWGQLRALVYAGLAAIGLMLPGGVLTLLQMHDPNYAETFVRLGLVHTHLPSAESFLYGRWIAAGALLAALLWRYLPRAGTERYALWVASGAGFVAALFLNVATGIELTLGVHIGRLAIPWLPLAAGALSWEWWRARPTAGTKKSYALFALCGVLLLAVGVGAAASVPRGFDFFKFDQRGQKTAAEQAYAAPLNWLERHVPNQSVVFADAGLSTYLPIMTRHYPLFFEGQVLHSISDGELQERYLLSHSFDTLTLDDLRRDLSVYAGAGKGNLEALALNEGAYACNLIARITGPRACPAATDGVAMAGPAYFEVMLKEFAAVKKNRAALLAQYHVSYVLVDRQRDAWSGVPLAKALYDDGRFAIVPVSAL